LRFAIKEPEMSADGWDHATDDLHLIALLGWDERGLARKRRLYLIALCRHFWRQVEHESARKAIEVAESYLEGGVTVAELQTAHDAHSRTYLADIMERGKRVVRTRECQMSHHALEASKVAGCSLTPASHKTVATVATTLLRDIFGNPFRPVAFASSSRTSSALGLARTMYDSRDFGAMPILADALEEAGCDHPDILAHCRGLGPHVRGCWVVDLVLGKA
jgi:hypothetical protein